MELTGIQRKILYHLSQSDWVSPADLAQRVYDNPVAIEEDLGCIRSHIYRLRKRLPDTIGCQRNKGYYLKKSVPDTFFVARPVKESEPPTKSRVNHWTPDDEDVVRDVYHAGWSDQVIAQRLGRTKGAVQVHRFEMGLRWKRGQKGKESGYVAP